MITAKHSPVYYYPMAYERIRFGSGLWAKLAQNPRWVLEKKYNEIRCQIHIIDYELVAVYNRHGHKLSHPIADTMLEMIGGYGRGECIYDCGLRTCKIPGYRNKLVIYDCIRYNGLLLTDTAYERRLELLPVVEFDRPLNRYHSFGECAVVSRPAQFHNNDWNDVIAELPMDDEAEGVVLKNLDGLLRLSRVAAPKTCDILKWRFNE